MCGICVHFEYGINQPHKQQRKQQRELEAMKCVHRGPDNTVKYSINDALFTFHRLAINDLSSAGNQPFIVPYSTDENEIICMCNGEIYNSKQLIEIYSLPVTSSSDCEVIPLLYKKFYKDNAEDAGNESGNENKKNIEDLVKLLDGYFACVLVDTGTNDIFVFRDYLGIRSLYIQEGDNYLTVASELKCLDNSNLVNARQFPPRSIRQYSYESGTMRPQLINEWTYYDFDKFKFVQNISKSKFAINKDQQSEKDILLNIRSLFKNAVKKRLQSDRKVGAFLSGGFDSSVVCHDLASLLPEGVPLHTFSIGLKGSPDLLASRKVAKAIKSIHKEYVVTPQEMLLELEGTIRDCETYDVTSIRASAMMRKLSRLISEDTDIVVVFSGEGSDEASGSYLYFHNAPSAEEFQSETLRLLKDLHFFDVLRGDKSTASAGLEIRVPFLDRDFIEYYMSIDPALKQPIKGIEKYLLRKAFADDPDCVLPAEIIWRTKEAFSDGVSTQTDSWFEIIKEYVSSDDVMKIIDQSVYDTDHCRPQSIESAYYRSIFNKYYPNAEHVVPYMWLPKWSGNVTDPSARVLNVYKEVQNLN